MRNLLAIPLVSILLVLVLASCAPNSRYTPQRTYDPCETEEQCGLAIQQAIIDNWSRPEGARNHMIVIIEVALDDSFEIESRKIIESSGSKEYDEHALEAAKKASPFSELSGLPGGEFEKYFKVFRLKFDPVDLKR